MIFHRLFSQLRDGARSYGFFSVFFWGVAAAGIGLGVVDFPSCPTISF